VALNVVRVGALGETNEAVGAAPGLGKIVLLL